MTEQMDPALALSIYNLQSHEWEKQKRFLRSLSHGFSYLQPTQ